MNLLFVLSFGRGKLKMPRKNEFKLNMVSIRLVKDAPVYSDHRIVSPEAAVDVMGDLLCEMDREVVCVINLKSDSTPINCSIVSIGAINQTIAHPREMLKTSILANAANIILMHNHPSGTLEPSREDTMLTDRMIQVCNLIGIPLLDHIIVGGDNGKYFSFKEKGIMTNPMASYKVDYHAIEFEHSVVAENDEKIGRYENKDSRRNRDTMER